MWKFLLATIFVLVSAGTSYAGCSSMTDEAIEALESADEQILKAEDLCGDSRYNRACGRIWERAICQISVRSYPIMREMSNRGCDLDRKLKRIYKKVNRDIGDYSSYTERLGEKGYFRLIRDSGNDPQEVCEDLGIEAWDG